jgi:membrane associated rhomboid family serine protease
MMPMTQTATIALCLICATISVIAFRDPSLKEKLLFDPQRILRHKEWYRIFSSALVHLDLMHLCFNLVALYSFGDMVERRFGPSVLLFIFISSVLGGSLLSLFLHRRESYSALGASGGVCGVMFAAIFLVPGTNVQEFFLPVSVPGPVFAAIYLIATYIALRGRRGNIGHDAHFGGAIVGLLLALLLDAEACLQAPVMFIGALVFSIGCLYALARDPFAISDKLFSFGELPHKPNVRYQRYDENKRQKKQQEEIDRILDKIAATGFESLSTSDREKLHQASKTRKD